MASQVPAGNPPSVPDPFGPLQQLVSRIDSESRAQEVIDKARDLNAEERQLLVDVLSTTLNRSKILSKRHAYAWLSLIKIALSARVFAWNRIVKSEHAVKGSLNGPIYRIRISYHYIFLESEEHPYFVSPYTSNVKICDHAQVLTGDQRSLLISDVADGLCYLHQLHIVHGQLNPVRALSVSFPFPAERGGNKQNTIMISNDGRALITDLDATSQEQGSNWSTIRYAAPELLLHDDSRPTKATDAWAFACLGHEVLSGKVPFFQFAGDHIVSAAIAREEKPARPGQEGRGGDPIRDTVWNLLLRCWEYEAEERPKLQEILLHMHAEDNRPKQKLMNRLDPLETSGTIDLKAAKMILKQTLGPHQSSPLKIPEHLRDTVSLLVRDSEALDTTTVAANKLTREDTQILVDLIELVIKDLPHLPFSNLLGKLLQNIMALTYIVPQYYRVNDVGYDSTSLVSENDWAKMYDGKGHKFRVCVVKEQYTPLFVEHMTFWANASHRNLLPFRGVFYEGPTELPRLCLVLPYSENGTLEDYAPTLPQKSRMLLISDVLNGMAYLNDSLCLSIWVTGDTVLISNEGRAIIVSFGIDIAFRQRNESTLWLYNNRFLPSPAINQSGVKCTIWSLGCLSYQVLSRKLPYYQCLDEEVQKKISEGEPLRRPDRSDDEIDEIDDKAWNLITKCCTPNPGKQPDFLQIQAMFTDMEIEEDRRPSLRLTPLTEMQALRSRPEVDFDRAETLLNHIQAELLRKPLSRLIENHTRDVAAAVIELAQDDIHVVVDFLDRALKEILSIAEERNRVLAILCRITSSTFIFPQRFELKRIKHGPRRLINEGRCAAVYQETDPTICLKKMKRTPWIKEVILWAHSSHPNVLPFLGVILEGQKDSLQPCLVSPFMKNGNLRDYAARFPQKSRLPLISDVVDGLHYLHNLGVVHGDLKGENVLISDEGRGLIADFGTSHINTVSAATGSLSSTTLRFSAPETVLGNEKPTKQFDIWSLGCLFYAVRPLSLIRTTHPHGSSPTGTFAKIPILPVSIIVMAALARKELPKRPGLTDDEGEDEDEFDWDDDIEQDYDAINDQAWSLIMECCSPEPEDRPNIVGVQELVVDMKICDDRPAFKAVPSAEILKLRVDPKINLTRVEELFDQVQDIYEILGNGLNTVALLTES
ncbi:hypothetical protein AN958_00622 [Leucoagaricus sp. SymC.cos]|nr:hypothetical protein AN958_00622 [Leucoagaricus sp. SymC.cos]